MTAIIITCARLADVLGARRAMAPLAEPAARPTVSRAELSALFAADLADQVHSLHRRRAG